MLSSMYGSYGTNQALDVPKTVDSNTFSYAVEEGESLKSIASKFSTTRQRLRELNPHIVLPPTETHKNRNRRLEAGDTLVIDIVDTSSLPPPPDHIDNGWGTIHTVTPHDTLPSIAKRYNLTEQEIRQDNRHFFPVGERGRLVPGAQLHIRAIHKSDDETADAIAVPGGRFTPTVKYTSHVVQRGETFESICQQYNLTFAKLLEINRGRYPSGTIQSNLAVGTPLIVPDIHYVKPEESRSHVSEVKLTKEIYIVESGDTPESVMEAFNMTYEELREWNRAYFPKGYRGRISPGNKLVVRRRET